MGGSIIYNKVWESQIPQICIGKIKNKKRMNIFYVILIKK
jgi:hypothetical protein